VYERVEASGLRTQMLCYCAGQAVNGRWRGEVLQFNGQTLELVEGTETMAGLTLISVPEALSEPLTSDDLAQTAEKRLEKEVAIRDQRIKALEKEVLGEALTSAMVLELVEKHKKSFSDIAIDNGAHHQTIKDLFEQGKAAKAERAKRK
jgi:hypothetical protein